MNGLQRRQHLGAFLCIWMWVPHYMEMFHICPMIMQLFVCSSAYILIWHLKFSLENHALACKADDEIIVHNLKQPFFVLLTCCLSTASAFRESRSRIETILRSDIWLLTAGQCQKRWGTWDPQQRWYLACPLFYDRQHALCCRWSSGMSFPPESYVQYSL